MMETVPAGQGAAGSPPVVAASLRAPRCRGRQGPLAASGAGIPAAHPDTDTGHRPQGNERRETASYSVKNAKILARSVMEGMPQTALFQPQRSVRPEGQERWEGSRNTTVPQSHRKPRAGRSLGDGLDPAPLPWARADHVIYQSGQKWNIQLQKCKTIE